MVSGKELQGGVAGKVVADIGSIEVEIFTDVTAAADEISIWFHTVDITASNQCSYKADQHY